MICIWSIYNLFNWENCPTSLRPITSRPVSTGAGRYTFYANKLLDSRRGMALAGHLCSVPTIDPHGSLIRDDQFPNDLDFGTQLAWWLKCFDSVLQKPHYFQAENPILNPRLFKVSLLKNANPVPSRYEVLPKKHNVRWLKKMKYIHTLIHTH